MIIDFHSHTFPDAIADKAISKLTASADIINYLNGTLADITRSGKEAGIDYSVLLPVVTNPKQYETINKTAVEVNHASDETGIISFGGLHPENANYKEIINYLSDNNIKGIKLHPVFQNVNFDDISYKRIISYASEKDLIIVTHAGYDISYPGDDYVTPIRILNVIKEVAPPKMILAHMGGWDCWDDVERYLVGQDVWFDTAFTISPQINKAGNESCMTKRLSNEQFLRIVRNHGADRILFGTDSPWTAQAAEIELIKKSGLNQSEIALILGENAKKLLF